MNNIMFKLKKNDEVSVQQIPAKYCSISHVWQVLVCHTNPLFISLAIVVVFFFL